MAFTATNAGMYRYTCFSTPQKSLTLSRLELQAAVKASRLQSKGCEEIDLEIDETHLWSDFKIALHPSATPRGDSAHACLTAYPKSSRAWHPIPGKICQGWDADHFTMGKEI